MQKELSACDEASLKMGYSSKRRDEILGLSSDLREAYLGEFRDEVSTILSLRRAIPRKLDALSKRFNCAKLALIDPKFMRSHLEYFGGKHEPLDWRTIYKVWGVRVRGFMDEGPETDLEISDQE